MKIRDLEELLNAQTLSNASDTFSELQKMQLSEKNLAAMKNKTEYDKLQFLYAVESVQISLIVLDYLLANPEEFAQLRKKIIDFTAEIEKTLNN